MTLALSLAAAGDGTLPGDVCLARWSQAHPIPYAEPLTAFTNDYAAGTPVTLAGIALALALLAARRFDAALLIGLATALRSSNSLLKRLVSSPRPTEDVIAVTDQATGLGFPSGHAMGAALVVGAVAYLLSRPLPPLPGGEGPGVRARPASPPSDGLRLGRRPVRSRSARSAAVAACLALILLTGYARVHTGAHWPTDVLGGYLWGALLLGAAARVTRLALPWRHPPATGA